jgi:3D (Asp-Asp-Asp) domain-containing protein
MKKKLLMVILVFALLASGANEGSASSPTYSVEKGDTLYRIAGMHNITVENLKSRNKLESNLIYPNQELSIDSKTPSRTTPTNIVKEFTVSATAYTAYCEGCSGITKTGIDLRNDSSLKVIAVDPNVIELGTKVYVEDYGYAIAGDIGSAIKGNKIDVFIPTTSEALEWGRKTVKISIIE